MTGLLILLFFGFFGVIMVAFGLGFKFLESHQRRRVEQVLKAVKSGEMTVEMKTEPTPELAPEPGESSSLLDKFKFLQDLDNSIRGAALGWQVNAVLGAMAGLALAGGLLGARFNVFVFPWLSVCGLAAFLGMSPVLYINSKRKSRMIAFERQFPEALDFIARSVRAGHALSISLEMLCSEAEAPLGPEFRRLTNELNLGTPFDVGLRNLAERIPLVDVRFFVSAVLLQRETGGNLTEILTNLATLIRSRFRLKGQVKAMSSQGRITALVLTVLPMVLAVGLMIISPPYLKGMADDPVGRYMIVGALAGQVVGYVIMKKIVDIKV